MNAEKEVVIHYVRRPEHGYAIDLIIFRRDRRTRELETGKIVFEKVAVEAACASALRIEEFETSSLQTAMNDLWACGFRPSGEGTAGQLAQAEKHLADLRKIAFHALKIPGA